MLNIYIRTLVPPPSSLEVIQDPEEAFSRFRLTGTPEERAIMWELDNATFCDFLHFTDAFGTQQDTFCLSTGTKTLLSILNLENAVFDLLECGHNALNACLKYCHRGSILLEPHCGYFDTEVVQVCNVRISDYRFTSVATLQNYLRNDAPFEPSMEEGWEYVSNR